MAGPADDVAVDTSLAPTGNPMVDGPMVDVGSAIDGMMLPVASNTDFADAWASSSSPTNFAFQQNASGDSRADVLKFAQQFLGTPYKWGGSTPGAGFDCSGFTQYVLAHAGVRLPRISQQQANAGARTAIADLEPGDLVLFNENSHSQEGPGHVAIYMGNGRIIEAPHTGAVVRERQLGKNESVFGVHLNY